MFSIGSIFWLAFSDSEAIRSASEIRAESMHDFKKLYSILLNKGIYLGPSGYEVGFVSQAHTEAILLEVAELFCSALDEVFKA
jgi:glutamate-1-semialdehyde 2,1-aminomutase